MAGVGRVVSIAKMRSHIFEIIKYPTIKVAIERSREII
jgi:hypothetical protein